MLKVVAVSEVGMGVLLGSNPSLGDHFSVGPAYPSTLAVAFLMIPL